MISIWIGVSVVSVAALVALGLFLFYWYLRLFYGPYLVRGFEETPLFVIPRGKPIEDAEQVRFPSSDGIQLQGCYLRTRAERRLGVILFGLEFRSNRWSCLQYCEKLLEAGFDVFTYESRNQGDSEATPGYEPMQWVTHYEVGDAEAAVAYLKSRPDADPKGIGFFGISKGGAAGLFAASSDPYIRCMATDGVFGTWTVIVPYMRKWIAIYSKKVWLQTMVPSWFYAMVGRRCVRRICKQRGVILRELEPLMARLAPRPLLMIHGSEDSYIKPVMAEALFGRARQPKEFWLVDGARHNQALHIAGDAYHRRVVEFFQKNLAQIEPEQDHRNGEAERRTEEEPDEGSQPALEIALSSTQEAASPPR